MLERLIGANWRTTLTGILSSLTALLTILAALPYELGDAATIFPPEWKARIAVTGALATAILRVLKSAATKDARVSGNGSLDDQYRIPSEEGSRSKYLPFLLVPLLTLSGCATSTAGLTKDQIADRERARAARVSFYSQFAAAFAVGLASGAGFKK